MTEAMYPYVIFTDATADMPQEAIRKYDIQVLSMLYRLDDQDILYDGIWADEKIGTFYDRLRAGAPVSTSQISPGDYEEAFVPYLEKGMDVLYIAFSSGLSGTYQSSLISAKALMERFPGRVIRSVDTLCASYGEGIAVLKAAENRQQGISIEENARQIENGIQSIAHWFTVDDLMYLKRGGRVSAATAIIGTTLQIKPVMHVDEQGRLVPTEKAQGRRSSLKAIARKMRETGVGLEGQTVCIGHCDAKADAEWLAGMVHKTMPIRDVYIGPINPVIATHSGPGTLALFFLAKQR
jgi:DegV family protein with EDD domain